MAGKPLNKTMRNCTDCHEAFLAAYATICSKCANKKNRQYAKGVFHFNGIARMDF